MTKSGQKTSAITRRDWLGAATVGLAGVSLCSESWAQDVDVQRALRQMSQLTGEVASEGSLPAVAALVGVILESSQSLRKLDLHEFEPATGFLPE